MRVCFISVIQPFCGTRFPMALLTCSIYFCARGDTPFVWFGELDVAHLIADDFIPKIIVISNNPIHGDVLTMAFLMCNLFQCEKKDLKRSIRSIFLILTLIL